ncbi:hypothetical protein BH24ACT15_BH24ACT15_00490 [soil metagenome]|jgi:hypothetical protein
MTGVIRNDVGGDIDDQLDRDLQVALNLCLQRHLVSISIYVMLSRQPPQQAYPPVKVTEASRDDVDVNQNVPR